MNRHDEEIQRQSGGLACLNSRTVLRTLLAQASPPRSDGQLAGITAKNTERLIIVQIRLWIVVFAIATVFSPSPWSAMLFHGGRETLANSRASG
jgi:hypothetical protein